MNSSKSAWPKFKAVRKECNSHIEALEIYATMLSERYSLENLKSQKNEDIAVAKWYCFVTDGIRINPLILLLGGGLFISEKRRIHSFETFHSIRNVRNYTWRSMSCIFEAIGILIGLMALTIVVVGTASLAFSELGLSWQIKMIADTVGIGVLVVDRYILQLAKLVRIPEGIFRDKTSPFKLAGLRRVKACIDLNKTQHSTT